MSDDQEVVSKVMQSYFKVMADRATLGETLENYIARHNELYTLLITILRQNGGKMFVDKSYWPAFPCGEYLIDWEDAGDEVQVRVRHFSEDD